MAYFEVLVSMQIWHLRFKCLRIRALINTFYRGIKVFLILEVRKSVLKLTLAKLAFDKSDFFDLIKSDFLDLNKFTIDNRFSILSSTLLLTVLLPELSNISWFFLD